MNGPNPTPDIKGLLEQHRRTYPFQMSVGRIVLRHLPRLDADRITDRLIRSVDDYLERMGELHKLGELFEFCAKAPLAPPPTDAQKARLHELLTWAAPYLDEFALPCFVEPKLETVEELNALASALTENEWLQLQALLVPLARLTVTFNERELAFLTRLRNFNIPLASDLTGENITFDQSRALEQMTEMEGRTLTRIIGDGNG